MPRLSASAIVAMLAIVSPALVRAADPPQYVGAARCAQQNCHGNKVARSDSATSLQNEFDTWTNQDPHSKAYRLLTNEPSRRIAQRLGLGTEPQKLKKCLDCHAVNVPQKARGPQFRIEDGVTCEACHGPAGAWMGRHTEGSWDASKSIRLGMRDTMRPAVAVETCLACHLGSSTARVDHEMLAAGHPPLVFELDSYAARMPAHWAENAANRGWFRGEAWIAGQVVAAREAALHYVRQVHGNGWPDFAAYECQACHHELDREWQVRGSKGLPPAERSRTPNLDAIAKTLVPGEREAVARSGDELARLVGQARGGPELDTAATDARRRLGTLLAGARSASLDERRIEELMREIVALAEPTARLGFRAAQQAAWALEALIEARSVVRKSAGRDRDDQRLLAAITTVFDGLRDPNAYDADKTAQRLAAIRVPVQ